MTLTTTTDRVTYQGNGTATLFTYPFMIFAPTDLVVTLTDDVTGVVTPLALNVGFTLSTGGLWPSAQGQIYIADPPATGVTLDIRRALPLVQEADFTNQGSFYPDRHERALDRVYAVLQGVSTDVGNALQLSADGTVWNAEGLRLTSVADGTVPTDAATLGQLEQVAQNLAAGQAAFSPLVWQYASTGGNVYSLPGAALTRSDAYIATWDGVMQSPQSYAVGTSSNPFVMVFDTNPPVGATILIRSLATAEALTTADIDASGVVSGVFTAARLGAGSASDAVFLAGGPSGPTWTNTLNGAFQAEGNITTSSQFIGSADTTLITTGIFPPARLGTGVYGVNTVLHGDGVYRIPAVATTTGFGLSDAVNAPDVFTSLVFTGDVDESNEFDNTIPRVKIYIKGGIGTGAATLEGYVDSLVAESFGNQNAYSVLANFSGSTDTPAFYSASTNNTVLGRFGGGLSFSKVPIAALDTTGTPNGTKFLRDDGQFTAVTASLGTTAAVDPAGNTPAVPGTGAFYRADAQWANTLNGSFFVQGSGGTPPRLEVVPLVNKISLGAVQNSLEIPITCYSWVEISNGGGTTVLTGNDVPDRLSVNGRARAVRFRGEGAPMVRQQSTATSGAITLDHNAYGHFLTSPAGNITYTFSDGGADPTSGAYASEFTLEIFAPGANVITWPGSVVWGGGAAPTMSAAGVNYFRFMKRQGTGNYIGALIVGGNAAGFTTEDAQDAVGTILASSASIALTYSDGTPSITAALTAGGVGAANLATNAVETAKIADGAVTNLKVAAGTLGVDRLSATGTRDSTTALFGDGTWKVPAGGSSGQAAIQFRDEGSARGSLGAITSVNFTGAGVTASAVGTALTVDVTAAGAIVWKSGGFTIGPSSTYSNVSFGTGLSVSTPDANTIVITASGGGGGGGGQAAIQFSDEGTPVGSSGLVTSLNVVGAGATLSVAGTSATLTIPGGSGASTAYNVKDYGAAGNGISDDTSEIVAAIAAAVAAGGGLVFFPAGTYNISSTIDLSLKRVILYGVGPGASTIRWTGATGGTMFTINGATDHIGMQGLSLIGQVSSRPARILSIGALQHSRFINLSMSEFTGYGIYAIPEATNRVMAWNHFESIAIDARNNSFTPTATAIYMDGGNGNPAQANCCHNTFVQLAISHNGGGYAIDFRDSDNNFVSMLFAFQDGASPGVNFGANARSNYLFHCQARISASGTGSKNVVFGYDRENGQGEPTIGGAAEMFWLEGGGNSYPGMYFKTAAGTYSVKFDGGLGDVVFTAPNSGGAKRAQSI